ncbi:sec24-related protein [Anaeramoeba flamelloides]|uniref:Sec24-related protein n=1 Tax=Anaeramoeba flamelloides TaxID=1746091 RepID=A0AAV8A7F8_9EUKA|nr:sec24-related protein [Anaeramoeba flamelloides]
MARYRIPSYFEATENQNTNTNNNTITNTFNESVNSQQGQQTQPKISLNTKVISKLNKLLPEEYEKLSASKQYLNTNFSIFPGSPNFVPWFATKAPLCVTVEPFAEKKQGTQLSEVPVIDLFKQQNCIRCSSCSAYISSFCEFHDQGRIWMCAMCETLNALPLWYYSPLLTDGKREDLEKRSELNSGAYEFVAVNQFMNRNPVAPLYLFVLDVTRESIKSGRLVAIARQLRTILENGELFGQDLARIGFLTFDSTAHVWSFNPENEKPHMFVLSDFSDCYLPCPSRHLLINPNTQQEMVFQFLDSLPEMFDKPQNQNLENNISTKAPQEEDSAFSLVLQIAYLLMSPTGGKLFLTIASRPSLGKFALAGRDKITNKINLQSNQQQSNQQQQSSSILFSPLKNNLTTRLYREMAENFNDKQISVDIFFFPQNYLDVATIGLLARYTSGEMFYYRDHDLRNGAGRAFEKDFAYVLKRYSTWESVMRCRVNKEFQISKFYGNTTISSSQLIGSPTISPDDSFLLKVVPNNNAISGRPFLIQCAVVYTTEKQQRRVRVITSAIPTSESWVNILASLNSEITFNYIIRKSIDLGLSVPLNKVREEAINDFCNILIAFFSLEEGKPYLNKTLENGGETLILPNSLSLLPLFTVGLTKNAMFSNSSKMNLDERAYYFLQYHSRAYHETTSLLCPHFYRIDQLDPNSNQPQFPNRISLTLQNLTTDGIFLLANGIEVYIFIGEQVGENLLFQLFGIKDVFNVPSKALFLPKLQNNYNKLIRQFIKSLNNQFSRNMITRVIKQSDHDQDIILRWLIEDKTQSYPSIHQFNKNLLQRAQRAMNF